MFAEDLTPFFSDFAVDANLGGRTVRGILDLAYIEPLGNAVEGSAPVFTLPSIDGDVPHGTFLVVGPRSFKVCGVEPDGTGVTLLRLERQ